MSIVKCLIANSKQRSEGGLTLAPEQPSCASRVTQPGRYRLSDLPALWIHALIQERLTAQARLILFQVSKSLAALVLHHAAGIQLRLTGSSRNTAEGQQGQAQRHAIETILAMAPEAEPKVILDGGGGVGHLSPVWEGQIRLQVKHLTLARLAMTVDLLQNKLQLQLCSQLQTLVLGSGCEGAGHPQSFAEFAAQYADILPPSLTRLIIEDANPSAAEDMILLASPQLTHLSYSIATRKTGLRVCPRGDLRQLSHVTVDHLDDETMCFLQALPSITHVTAQHMSLIRDYSSSRLSWQQLELLRGASLRQLRLLPIPNIQHLVIHGSVKCSDTDTIHQDLVHIASCANLQCVPHIEAFPGHPEFTIRGRCSSELVTFCANSLTGSASLNLVCTLPRLPQLQSCLSTLPQKVDVLLLYLIKPPDTERWTAAQGVQVLQQLVSALPSHIKQLVIHHNALEANLCTYANAIISQLQASQLTTKLVMALRDDETAPAELQALVQAHPGRMGFVVLSH